MGKILPYKILFLCTGNSARNVIAEYLIREIAPRRFESYSAGSATSGEVNPHALEVLAEYGIDASTAKNRNVNEFIEDGIEFDLVITLCDGAKFLWTIWPGAPVIAHWDSPDPEAANGMEETIPDAFRDVALQIRRRLELFCRLPLERMDHLTLRRAACSSGNQDGNLAKERLLSSNPYVTA